MLRVDILVEFVDQAEDVGVVFLQEVFEIVSRCGPRRILAGDAAAGKGLINLIIEVVAVGHQKESEIPRHLASNLLGEERHGIGLAASLRVPEHAEPAKIGMRSLDDLDWSFWDEGWKRRRRRFALLGRQPPFLLGDRPLFQRQLNNSMLKALLRWEHALQLLLPLDRTYREVYAKNLMVACNYLPGCARLTFVEQDEILDDVEQTVVRQHAVEQHFGIHLAPFGLAESLPLVKVFPFAGD